MANKRFNSKFYCLQYMAMAPVSKAPDDKFIPCEIYGTITKELVEEWKKNFDFIVESINEEEKLKYECYSIKGFIPKMNLKKAKNQMKENGIRLHSSSYVYMCFEIPGNYLYSGWKTGRKTKIKPEDLPESYIRTTNYKKDGYLETAGVVDIEYKESPFHNHTFKDDFLFISYSKKLPELHPGHTDEMFDACDEYIFGNDILNIIEGIEKNNTDNKELQDKIKTIKARMVNQYNAFIDEVGSRLGSGYSYVKDFSELR